MTSACWAQRCARFVLTCALLLVASLAGALTPGGTVNACSCSTSTDAQAFTFADAVFTGVLTETVGPPPSEIVSSADPQYFVFAVDEVWKGDVTVTQRVATARDTASCGIDLEGPGPYLVFADVGGLQLLAGDVEAPLATSLCSGTRLVAEAPLEEGLATGSRPAPDPPDSSAAPTRNVDAAAAPGATAAERSDDGTRWAWPVAIVLSVTLVIGVTLGVRWGRRSSSLR